MAWAAWIIARLGAWRDKYDRIDIILENLRNYTVKHFSDEEQYMESIMKKNQNIQIVWC